MRTLTVADLGHWHHHDSAHDLQLTVGDLLNWLHWNHGSLSGGLNLSVRDLGDSSGRSGGLDLAVAHLRNRARRGTRSGSHLAVSGLGCGTALHGTTTDGLDVDRAALATLALVVQVVEVATQALVEDSLVAKDEGAVAADSEARGVDSIGLEDGVELELAVGDDLTLAVVLVLQDTVVEGDAEGTVLAL